MAKSATSQHLLFYIVLDWIGFNPIFIYTIFIYTIRTCLLLCGLVYALFFDRVERSSVLI